jgi:hypothetical protein
MKRHNLNTLYHIASTPTRYIVICHYYYYYMTMTVVVVVVVAAVKGKGQNSS